MENTIINRFRSKAGWLIKRKKLKRNGNNSHVGYGLVLKNPQNISIGDRFNAGINLVIETWEEYGEKKFTPEIVIGSDVSVMDNCQISCAEHICIGTGTLFGSNVFITDNFHGDNSLEQLGIPPVNRALYVKGKVIIGKNVWVGRNVCILPGVTIGDGAVIGANAVVTKDVPSYTIAAGIPAKVIKCCRGENLTK